MEKCFEYLKCSRTDCIMYGKTDDTKCWGVDGTLCNHPGMELMKKMDEYKCAYCIYYKAANVM